MSTLRQLLIGGLTDARTWKRLLYVLLGLPFGIVAVTVIATGVGTGIGLLILVIGLPLLWATMAASQIGARFDAQIGRHLIDPGLTMPPPVPGLGRTGTLRAMGSMAISGQAWRSVVWHLLRLIIGSIGLTAAAGAVIAAYGLVVQAGWGVLYDAPAWVRGLAVAGGISSILLVPYIIDALAWVLRASAGPLLGRSRASLLKQEAERSATAEARVDLARDLHDSVGHSVTAAVLQASAARKTLRTDPEFADQALASIEERGRAALEELDRVLAMMRDEGASGRRDEGLDRIDELIGAARASGQPVTLTQRGDMAAVPPAIAREGYRVVQEGVTNAMRHAAGAATSVDLVNEGSQLTIEVLSGPGEPLHADRDSGGRGLVGVTERARVFDGTVTSGPTGDGGFRLRVELPYGGVDG